MAVTRDWNKTPWRDWHRWPDKPPVFYIKPGTEEDSLEPSGLPAAEPRRFSLRVVDEIGDPVAGLRVAYDVGGDRRTVLTGEAGDSAFQSTSARTASAALPDLDTIRGLLEGRWVDAREPKQLSGANVITREFGEALLDPISLEHEAPTTLVITPAMTWVGFQLVDDEGEPMAGQRYRLVTPSGEVLDGTLDSNGAATHEGLARGTCQLCLVPTDEEQTGGRRASRECIGDGGSRGQDLR
jgi:hypothetical protein